MQGVSYVIDAKGRPKAVLIDLKKNRRLWEDFQDLMISEQRRKEPHIPLEEVIAGLRKAGKLK